MSVPADLLEILVCPKSHGSLELVDLPDDTRKQLADKYREHFRDEEPVIEQGLWCAESGLLYPVVSDVPVMLIEDALPGSAIGRAADDPDDSGSA